MTKYAGINALALLAALGACGGPDQPAAPATEAAGMTMEGPFAESEWAMDKAMKAAIGVDAADTWVKKMIAHHEGAITMSKTVLALEPTAAVAQMAQMTIDKQGAEIEVLKALARRGAADPASARLYESVMTQMHDAMMAASGGSPSETYLAKMLAHHRGAVAMSDLALENGATGAVRRQIAETRAQQLKEAAVIEALQRGEPVPTETPAAATPPASAKPAVARPAPAEAPAARPSPARPTAAPTAEPKASPTCEPEHRAAGHC